MTIRPRDCLRVYWRPPADSDSTGDRTADPGVAYRLGRFVGRVKFRVWIIDVLFMRDTSANSLVGTSNVAFQVASTDGAAPNFRGSESSRPPRARVRSRVWCQRLPFVLALLMILLGRGDATAGPGMRPPKMSAYAAELFYQPEAGGALGKGDQAFARLRKSKAFVETDRPFESKSVVVDSAGVHFTPETAGFPSGIRLTMALEDYLSLGLEHTLRTRWRSLVRRRAKVGAAQQRRRGSSKLEWRVPFPAPKPIQRFIGDEGSLRINGQHTATIAGKSQWTAGEVQTLSGRPSKFPSLALDQESKFLVEGSVGEAINIRIDQNTQNVGSGFGGLRDQFADQIKLDYKGDEDAVFQEIQAGNTSLSLPGSRFVGFNQQGKGLFGVRTKGRVGPLKFTTIASHEKSESNRTSFRGGAQVDTVTVRDFEYLRNTYFFLDEVYRERLPDFRAVALANPPDLVPEDIIDESSLQVYINDFNVNNDAEQQAQPGDAFVNPDVPNKDTGSNEEGTWTRLDPDDDYVLVREFGYIIMRQGVQDRHALAVLYRTRGGQQFGFRGGDRLRLKLIKPRDARPTFPTWNLEWKNVYRIVKGFSRAQQFEVDQIRVEVLEEVPGRELQAAQGGKNLLQTTGLDQRGQDRGSQPDQIIDPDYIGLDPSRGVLIFPDQTPFDPRTVKYGGRTLTRVPDIYDKHQTRDQREASRYVIQVVNSSAQQRINLSKGRLANIDPKSVEVILNGLRLKQGTDYNVSFTGEVTFLGNAQQTVSDPGADLEITFESQDLFGLGSQQKTLLGMRGEYEFLAGDATIGGTLIYNNERSNDRRVRVGNEPARTVVWDMDLNARFESTLLTRLVDAMPLLKTAAVSDVTVQAEVAQSRPNLNTKGEAYIDDFESSERPESLSIFRTRWTPASPPEVIGLDSTNRAKTIWYNPFDRVRRADIWPGQEDQVEARDNSTDVLVMDVAAGAVGFESWGGVTTAWSGGIRDFSQSKFIEVWLRGDVGTLHIDLGAIDEDVNEDGVRNTEDRPFPGRATGDGLVSPEEDIGIDGRDDRAELDHYLTVAGVDTSGLSQVEKEQQFGRLTQYAGRDPKDPEGDNFSFDDRSPNDTSHINGTEGNLAQAGGQKPDTEDLNNDGILNTSNDYFHHVIRLADLEVSGSRSRAGWRLFRLPLYDAAVERVGNPDSSRIEYGRLILVTPTDAVGPTRVEIAKLEIIGNEWQEDDIEVLEGGLPVGPLETFNITTIGTDENTEYQHPPKVKVRQRTTGSRALEREQSLVLQYENLEPDHQATATRILTKNTDYTKYTRLRMWVHGDKEDLAYVVEQDSSELEVFLRFGRDDANYYEFATPVFPNWDDRNEVDIDLFTMSRLKAELQSGRTDSLGEPLTQIDSLIVDQNVRNGAPARYRVRGNPSMQQIKRLSVGVRNRSVVQSYSGQVLVDEMRLDEARNDAGFAAFARVNTKLADFMNFDGTVEWRGEDFRTISSTGRKSSDFKASLNTTTNAQNLLPGSWGFSAPIKATFSRSESLPRFGPNSDVELTSQQKQVQRTETTKSFYEISVSKRFGKYWLTRWTLDNMNLRLSKTRERGISPTVPVSRRNAETFTFSYKMPLPKPSVKIAAWMPTFMPKSMRESRLRYLPTTMNYTVNVNRQDQATWKRSNPDTTVTENFTLKETYTSKINPLTALQGDYSLQVNRDLRKKYDLSKLAFGREVSRNQKADLKVTLRFLRWVDQTYTYQANYQESSDPRQRRATVVFDSTTGAPIRTLDVTTKNNLSANLSLKLPRILKTLGKPGPKKSRRGRSAAGDSTANPFILRRLLHYAGGLIEPVRTTWRRNTDARSFNLTGRPSLSYQLGIRDSLEVLKAASGLTQQDQNSRRTNLEFSSGLRLPLGFSVKPSFKENVTRRSGSTQDRLRIKEEEAFPRITVNWGRADRLPLLKRVFNSAQVNFSFNETNIREAEGSLSARDLLSKGVSRQTTVSWNSQLRVGPSMRVSFTRNVGEDLDYELANPADSLAANETPPLRGISESEKSKTSVEMKYNLRPRRLPFIGDLKSNVDLVFRVEVESETRSSGIGEQEATPISDTGRLKVELNGTYKFSDNFRGQGVIRVENNRNELTEKTRKLRELRMSGTLFFR